MARLHQRVLFQRRLHDAPLHSLAAPVNDPHLPQPLLVALPDVLLHNARNVPGRERVQVDVVLDGEDDGVFVGRGVVVVFVHGPANVAVLPEDHGDETPKGFRKGGRHFPDGMAHSLLSHNNEDGPWAAGWSTAETSAAVVLLDWCSEI